MTTQSDANHQIESIIGTLLRVGVLLAAAVVMFGAAVYLYRHGAETLPDYGHFREEAAQFRDMQDIIAGIGTFGGRAIIQFGLLLLIATPVARVVFSAVAFGFERDWLYVAITLVVLGTL